MLPTKIKTVRRVITSDELKGINASPLTLTAPVPGKLPYPLSATAIYLPRQTDYTLTPDSGSPYLYVGDMEDDWIWSDTFLTNRDNLMVGKRITFGGFNFAAVPIAGLPLILRRAADQPNTEPYTAGDGSVLLSVQYYEIDLT
jgi:hypothetical protein